MPATTTSTASTYSAETRRGSGRAVGLWLLGCCAMVLAMAVIGAITRLTESGLSIMEWAPISGALPPLSQAEWERLFALYRQIPEYQQVNAGMSLEEFRSEEHTSELQSLMRISYAVFCLKKKHTKEIKIDESTYTKNHKRQYKLDSNN